MDYSSTFNIASKVFHTVMDIGEAAVSVVSVPVGTAAAGLYTMMGTGYMGLGFSPQIAMMAGGGAGVIALGLTSYWACKSIGAVFRSSAEDRAPATPEAYKADFSLEGLVPA